MFNYGSARFPVANGLSCLKPNWVGGDYQGVVR